MQQSITIINKYNNHSNRYVTVNQNTKVANPGVLMSWHGNWENN